MTAAFCRRPSGDAPNILRPTPDQTEAFVAGMRSLLAALGKPPEPNASPSWPDVSERVMPSVGGECSGISLGCAEVGDRDSLEESSAYAAMR